MRRDWFAVFAGPLAWFAAHTASWMIVPGAHESGSLAVLYAIDAIALAVALSASVIALGRTRALLRQSSSDHRVQRARFVAVSGLALSALSVLLVIGLALPILLLLPGAEP